MGASPASHRPARIAYANGQRLCFIDGGASLVSGSNDTDVIMWDVVVRPFNRSRCAPA